jgi:hypothetical protein
MTTTTKKVQQHLYYAEEDDDTTCSTTSNSDDDDDDDSSSSCEDEATTAAEEEEEIYGDCRSKLSPPPSVSFATPLITDIHYRPRTLRQDKVSLYYCDADYRSFRRDAYREAKKKEDNDRQQTKNGGGGNPAQEQGPPRAEGELRSVRFQSQVVTKVWEYDYDRNDSMYWYSEAEIQEYVSLPVCRVLVDVVDWIDCALMNGLMRSFCCIANDVCLRFVVSTAFSMSSSSRWSS